jgi:hypothetical protein
VPLWGSKMNNIPEHDAYFAGVKARTADIPKIKNPYNSARSSFIDAMYVDKKREEWDRGWDAENEYINTGYRRNLHSK